jgi:hypothetical protein
MRHTNTHRLDKSIKKIKKIRNAMPPLWNESHNYINVLSTFCLSGTVLGAEPTQSRRQVQLLYLLHWRTT